VPAHRAEGATVIHVIDGRLALSAGGRDIILGPGQLTALDAHVGHGLMAVEDCAFVLTAAGGVQHPAERQPRTRSG
jgi:quercetin dioxygenase-like cupin family protein